MQTDIKSNSKPWAVNWYKNIEELIMLLKEWEENYSKSWWMSLEESYKKTSERLQKLYSNWI